MKRVFLVLSMVIMGLTIFESCKKSEVTEPVRELTVNNTSLVILRGEKAEVEITGGNDGYQVTASNDKVKPSLKGKKIIIKALECGESTVTLTDAENKSLTIKVTVSAKDIAVNANIVAVQKDQTAEIDIIAGSGSYTAKADNDHVTVVVENNKVKITGVSKGKSTVTVTDTKTNKTVQIAVTVTLSIPDIALDKTTIEVNKDETKEVTAVSGSGSYTAKADNDHVTVVVENNKIKITGVSEGLSTVTVTDNETKKKATVTVTVKESYPDLAVDTEEVKIEKEGSIKVNITDGSGSYKVEANNDNVEVKLTGTEILITGKKVGESEVTVTDTKTNQTVTIGVTIENKTPDIALAKTEVTVIKGKFEEVTVNAGSGSYTAKADNSKVTVTVSGTKIKITGADFGTAKVTVTDTKTQKTATIDVKVVKELKISEADLVIYNQKVTPANAPEKQTKSVSITSGSGNYKVEVTKGANLINAFIVGGNSIKITSKSTDKGVATVLLTDNETSLTKEIEVRVTEPLAVSNSSKIVLFTNTANKEVTFIGYYTTQGDSYDHIEVSSNKTNVATVTKVKTAPYMGIKVQAGNTTGNAVITITDHINTITIDVEVKKAKPFKILAFTSPYDEIDYNQTINLVMDPGAGLMGEVNFYIEGSGQYEFDPATSTLFAANVWESSGDEVLTIMPLGEEGTVNLKVKDVGNNETKNLKLNITEKKPFEVSFTPSSGTCSFDNNPMTEAGKSFEGKVTMKVGDTGTFTLTGGVPGNKYNAEEFEHVNSDPGVITKTSPDGTGTCTITAEKAGTYYLKFNYYGGAAPELKYYKIVVTN